MVLFALFSRNMEWTDAHDIQLAREVLVREPFRFKPRTVERGKVWQEIANRLNENRLIHFRVTKRSTREHFKGRIHDRAKMARIRQKLERFQ